MPWEDRFLLVAAYWRTNLGLRQLAPLFRSPKSAAGRIIDQLAPSLALQPRKRFPADLSPEHMRWTGARSSRPPRPATSPNHVRSPTRLEY
jgi:hypothetical protein